MTPSQPIRKPAVRRAAALLLITVAAVTLTACSHAMGMVFGTGAQRPAASQFGLGPRASAQGRYVATLEPERPLHPRQTQTVRVTVVDGNGLPIEDAAITIDGGMPQHGHGLPTRPRVTERLGAGTYLIEGVRFNMGGWWEFKVSVATAAGADTITFNLNL